MGPVSYQLLFVRGDAEDTHAQCRE